MDREKLFSQLEAVRVKLDIPIATITSLLGMHVQTYYTWRRRGIIGDSNVLVVVDLLRKLLAAAREGRLPVIRNGLKSETYNNAVIQACRGDE